MASALTSDDVAIPRSVDTIVVGGGTAGSAIAGTFAEESGQSVLLLEAGPDYGPYLTGRWPADLLDAAAIPATHQWGYDSGATFRHRVLPFERARVIGGCSSHNGCAAIWGSRLDYDGWVTLGNAGWSTEELLPLFRAGSARLRVQTPAAVAVTPYQRAYLDAAPRLGIPLVPDLNDVDEHLGIAPSPANIVDGVRWNASFAYVDPVRSRANFTVVGRTLVDRLLIAGDCVRGVAAITSAGPIEIEATRVIIAAGTYGSPAILLRSGIGDEATLRAAGIAPRHLLPGVGRNLHDHPSIVLRFRGTPELECGMRTFATAHWTPEEQVIAKAQSSHCQGAFDLHLYPVGGIGAASGIGSGWALYCACLTPRSRGMLTISNAAPDSMPLIDHHYLSDPDGIDRAILAEGLRLARELTAQPPLAALLGEEIEPGPDVRAADDINRHLNDYSLHYYHPVGTCKMGPASDPDAVVTASGAIHGLQGGYVADCSIMPVIPRANTNLPGLVVGLRVAHTLLDSNA